MGHRPTPSFEGQRLSWDTDDGITVVGLHHAPCNEIGLATVSELERLADWLEHPEGPRVLVWTSELASGFSAGDDLLEVRQRLQGRDSPELTLLGPLLDVARRSRRLRDLADRAERRLQRPGFRRFLRRIHRVFDRLDAAPCATIAAVHGVCFGGGWELALTADLIVADASARFALPELRLGTIPAFGAIPRLERDLGAALLRDLLLTGRSLRARRLAELGLVQQVVPRGEATQAALRLAGHVAQHDVDTVRMAKRFLARPVTDRLAQERSLVERMVTRPVFLDALNDFARRQGAEPRPYLVSNVAK